LNTVQQSINTIDRLRIRFWLSQIVLLIALWGIILEDISRSPLLIALVIFLIVSLIFPPIAGWMPRKWMRHFSIALILFVALDLAFHWPQLLEPILRGGYLVLWTRTIFYRTSREASQLLLLAMFLIMLTGVLSVSVSYVVQLILFTPLAMVLLMLNTTKDPAERDELTHADWGRFRIRPFFHRISASLNWHLLGMVILCTAFMVISISTIFIILPRFRLNQMIPSLSLPGTAKSGFTEQFQLGAFQKILEDPSIAFRVETQDVSSFPETPYWRMLVLDIYENGQFSRNEELVKQLRAPVVTTAYHFVSNRMIENPGNFNGNEWTIYLEGSVSRYLPFSGSFRSIEFQSIQQLRIDPVFGTFNIRNPSSQVVAYRLQHVESEIPFRSSSLDSRLSGLHWRVFSSEESQPSAAYPVSAISATLSSDDARYLESIADRIRKSTASLDPRLSLSSIIQGVVDYLQKNHSYSLEVQNNKYSNESHDPVIEWMKKGDSGYCEYFAAAAALLFRANDIPSRVVTGFAGGEWNRNRTVFTVRNLNAHAWCEVYSTEEGWVRVDPTPPDRHWFGDSEMQQYGTSLFGEWFAWVEDLKLNYYRSVINFDEQSQFQFASKLGTKLQNANLNFGRLGNWMNHLFDAEESSAHSNATNQLKKIVTHIFWLVPVVAVLFLAKKSRSLAFRNARNREQKIRLRAKQLLQKFKSCPALHPTLVEQLHLIRFGPIGLWPDTAIVFKKIRIEMRQARTRRIFRRKSE